MTLKETNLIQSQLNQHKANHGKFTIEVARLELLLTETHVKLADLFRSSGLGIIQQGSEYQYLQALNTNIYTRKTLSAPQPKNRPSCRAPWLRQSVSGPTLIRESFGTTSTGPRSNPGAHQHCRLPRSTGQTWRYPDHPWRNPKQTGSASNTRPDQPWG